METYLWMIIGAVVIGFFAKTYWDVYMAYRAYMNTVVLDNDVLATPSAPSARVAPRPNALTWLLEKGDRFLHALLMSPISR